MGISSDGLLWYGAAFDDEEGEDRWDKIGLALNGPDEDSTYYGDGREWMAEHGITGIEFVQHCSYDYLMHGIAIAGTVTRAYRGRPKHIEPLPTPDVEPVLSALRALGIDTDGLTLGWHLASMYG